MPALAIAVIVVAGALVAVPTPAAAARPNDAALPDVRSTPTGVVKPRQLPPAQTRTDLWRPPGPAQWPPASSTVVDVSASRPRAVAGAGVPRAAAGLVRAGSSPVWVDGVGGSRAAAVRVAVVDRAVAQKASVPGLLVSLARTDGVAAPADVDVAVDLTGIRSAYGADFLGRLRVARMPACVLTLPADPACQAVTPLDVARVDLAESSLRMRVAAGPDGDAVARARRSGGPDEVVGIDAQPAVYALLSGTSSETGDFTKTPLSQVGSWQAGTSSGDFSWSMPIRVPPAPAGAAPEVSLGYSSGSVDGRTNAEGGQTSWVGEGWGYEPGYIERSYRGCASDGATGKDVKLYPSNGLGGFLPDHPTAAVLWDVAAAVWSAGDFDGDGFNDVIYRDATDTNDLYLARGNGAGGWATEPRKLEANGGWAAVNLMTSGDFTGDGKPDVIFRETATNNLFLRPGTGTGLGPYTQVGTGWQVASQIMSPGDWNGDGKTDLLWRRTSDGALMLLLGNGAGGWTGGSTAIGDFSAANFVFTKGDFSGDGKPDVLWRRGSDAALLMLRGNGLGGWITGTSDVIGTGWGAFEVLMATGDMNGDAKPDVMGTVVSASNPYWGTANSSALCWRQENATLSWAGRSSELIRDDATGVWKLADDDGSRLEPLTSAGINGDAFGMYWRLTTTDGTQYFFGRNRLPGWTTGLPETGSAWTAPIFANHTTDPCFSTTSFGVSYCMRAWRWNLDYVVDPYGNATAYYYSKQTNRTRLADQACCTTAYDRGGTVNRIEYGLRDATVYTVSPSAQVVFTSGLRCVTSCGTLAAPTVANWPDTPWDLDCIAGPCPNNTGPSFWTTSRLAKINTQVWSGSTWRDVDEYTLTHSFPATADTTTPSLWLDSIGHTGNVGGTVTLPTVTIEGERRANRSDFNVAQGAPTVNKYRLKRIQTGVGGVVEVTYDASDCATSTEPPQDQNTYRCFPQYYKPPTSGPGWSWWNKYRVSAVTEKDLVGLAPDVVHSYAYSTAGSSSAVLWSHNRSPWSTQLLYRTWSNWRGYPTVTVTEGAAGQTQSQTKSLYFRGMHGDRTLVGENTRQVTITDSEGVAVNDDLPLAGFARETMTLNGPGGQVLSGQINDPWQSTTATRILPPNLATPFILKAGFVKTGGVRSRTWLAHNSTWRRTASVTTFDPTYGTASQVDDFGDTTVAGDEACTRSTYLRNTSAWITEAPSRVESVGVSCATTPTYPADTISDVRMYYDGATTFGTAPTAGAVTKSEEVSSYSGGPVYTTQFTAVHDPLGRMTNTRDALNRLTTTAYTPAGGGPLTSTVVTNPAGHAATTTWEPAWGRALTVTDANSKVTTGEYDAVGRLVKVWQPGRATNLTPNVEYVYTLNGTTGPSSITTKNLNAVGNQIASYEIIDGLARPRQTQSFAPAANGGRIITDLAYDSRGLNVKTSTMWNASAPSAALASFADIDVPSQQRVVFDGAGRPTSTQLWALNVHKWSTTTAYDGDRTSITPPAGGTPTTTITDARGQTVELRQYTAAATPTGAYQPTTYAYDDNGHLTAMNDSAGNHWTYGYDLQGHQTSTVDPDKGTTTTTFDAAGQVTSTTDARSVVLSPAYDALGRVTSLWQGAVGTGTRRAEWVYDTLAVGQLTSATRYDAGNAYTTTVTGYNDAYQPLGTSISFPATEGVLSTQGPWVNSTTYNVDGSVNTQVLPSGGGLPAETVTSGYDANGYLTSSTGLAAYLASLSYYPFGQPYQAVSGPAGKQIRATTSIDLATGRLTASRLDTENQTTPGTWDERRTDEYGYDDAGNVKAVTEKLGGTVVSAQCFGYDRLRRLTDAWTNTTGTCAAPTTPTAGPDPYRSSWTYDQTGNRTGQTRYGIGGAADTVTTYTHPAPGAARPHSTSTAVTAGPGAGTNSYGYDNAGNTTARTLAGAGQTLTWDPEGHLATQVIAGQTTSYVYDAAGARLLRRDPDGSTTAYLPGQELKKSSGGSLTGTRFYANASRTAAGLTWLSSDHHGTADVAIDATTLAVTTRRLMPFGEARGSQPTWANDKAFVGGTADPTDLVHLGAREYDPTIGAFISTDPILDPSDPQQWNAYTYANANPTSMSDPDGLKVFDDSKLECSKECQETGRALDDYTKAQKDKAQAQATQNKSLKDIVIEAGVSFLLDLIGYNDLMDCIGGGVMGCVSLVMNVIPLGKIFKVAKDIFKAVDRVFTAYKAWRKAISLVEGLIRKADDALAAAKGKLDDFLNRGRKNADDAGGASPGCLTHSFDPDTPVLLADGTTKPIGEIQIGDEVVATDPSTGATAAKPVTTLHRNADTDLADVTIQDTDTGQTTTLHTTTHHPFWNTDTHTWTDAQDLTPGTHLASPGGTATQIVTAIKTWTGLHWMRDLTVADTHTYYVLAGDTPVLVHNCGDDIDFAHGTTSSHADAIEANGLSSDAARAASHGGSVGQPGSLFTYRVTGNGDPNLNVAAQWGVTRNGGVLDGAAVSVFRMCRCTYNRLVKEGRITTRMTGDGMPEETIFGPGAMPFLRLVTNLRL